MREQIFLAYEEQAPTLSRLREESGLTCSEESLGRKLRGSQTMRDIEIEALARALQIVVAYDGAQS